VNLPLATSLEGEIAVVTGAARGIGRAVAERLARGGARVAVLDVSPHRTAQAGQEMRAAGLDVTPYVVDVGQRAAVQATMQRVEADLGAPVSVLVNNAVWIRYQSVAETDEESVDRMLAVGLKGIFWTTQAAAAQMARRPDGAGGSIINISSIAAVNGMAGGTVYSALKAAVAGYTRAAAVELGPQGIRVNAVAPGIVATPASLANFSADVQAQKTGVTPLRRFGQPQEMAEVVAFLASAASSYVTGALLVADGGLSIASA
jgi:NAD(P)-dependent dehydrogenase (short-subunit alcohol dehydrogenase family)